MGVVLSGMVGVLIAGVVPASASKLPPPTSSGPSSPQVAADPSVPGDLVTNGGFETGDFSGWTLGGNQDGFTGVTNDPPNAHSGCCYAFFGAVGSDATVSQTLTGAHVGLSYTLSFWLLSDGGTPADFSATVSGTTDPGGTSTVVAPAGVPFGYTQFTKSFTVASANPVLTFTGRDDPGFWNLDDVSVVQHCAPGQASHQLTANTNVGTINGLFCVNPSTGIGTYTQFPFGTHGFVTGTGVVQQHPGTTQITALGANLNLGGNQFGTINRFAESQPVVAIGTFSLT
jgi:hypothetical protein